MHKLTYCVLRIGAAIVLGLAAIRAACAADLALVVVPQGMILETQVARKAAAAAPNGARLEFVVTHDLRVGPYVVVAAGSHGVRHLVRAGGGRDAATASRADCDYVLASDGTRIPVTGSLPYLTTRASRTVVIYGIADADARMNDVPADSSRTEAPR